MDSFTAANSSNTLGLVGGEPNQHDTAIKEEKIHEDTSGVSAVYFCFLGENADTPNRILLSSVSPTVSDLCSTLKVSIKPLLLCQYWKILFFPGQDLHLSCVFLQGGSQSEFGETSTYRLPVNNKNNVIYLKLTCMLLL
jgi:hypothetical protein